MFLKQLLFVILFPTMFPGLRNNQKSKKKNSDNDCILRDWELMVEIYSKSLVRAIGKVLLMKFS